jgi:hypothetical protein
MNEDIKVRLNFGLNSTDITEIQRIERSIDNALLPLGYRRVTSTKSGEYVEVNYYFYLETGELE